MKRILFFTIIISSLFLYNVYSVNISYAIGLKYWLSGYNLGIKYYASAEDLAYGKSADYPPQIGNSFGPHLSIKIDNLTISAQYLYGAWSFTDKAYLYDAYYYIWSETLDAYRNDVNITIGYDLLKINAFRLNIFAGYKNLSVTLKDHYKDLYGYYPSYDNEIKKNGNGIGGGANIGFIIGKVKLSTSLAILSFSGDITGTAVYLEGGADYNANPFIVGLKFRDEIYSENEYITGLVFSVSYVFH